MEISGFLTEIGELASPSEILDKPGKLTKEEIARIRTHNYYTDLILSQLKNFGHINEWTSLPHEKLKN